MIGMPCLFFSICSWMRPASTTVWPLLIATWLFTRRCEIVGVSESSLEVAHDAGDLLLDLQVDHAVGADARRHAQDDAGVLVLDRVDDGQIGRLDVGGRLDGDGDLVADLQGRGLVVDDDQRRRRQHLHVRHAAQRVEDEARVLLGAEHDVEAGPGLLEPAGVGRDRRTRSSRRRSAGRGRSPSGSTGRRSSTCRSASPRRSSPRSRPGWPGGRCRRAPAR